MTPPFPPHTQLVAYLRDSGHDTQELSIPQQKTAIIQWSQKHGYILTRIYTDTGTGTTTTGRDQFHAMLQYLRTKNIPETGLIVWKWNRFARDIDDAQFHRADLRKHGITLHSLNDTIPPGPDGRLFEAAIDWMNQRYIEDLRTDTKRGLKNLVQTHGCIPGTPPRGFTRTPVTISTQRDGTPHIAHRWIPDPDLIPIIQRAWRMRAAGATYRQIHAATQLYRSKNCWTTHFRNPLYTGILNYGDLTIEDYCKPIVDRQTFEAVQARNRKNKSPSTHNHPQRVNSKYQLTGLVYCAQCGSPLNGHTSTVKKNGRTYTYHFYRCSQRRHADSACTALPIPQTTLETTIKTELIAYLSKPQQIAQIHAQQNQARIEDKPRTQTEIRTHTKNLAQLRRKTENLIQAIAQHGPSALLLEKLTQFELQITQTEIQINTLTQTLTPAPKTTLTDLTTQTQQLTRAIQTATTKQLQTIYRGIIQKITVHRQKDTITGLITFYLPPPKKKPPPAEGTAIVCAHGERPARGTSHRHILTFKSRLPRR